MLKPCASHLHSRFLGQAPRSARKHSTIRTQHSVVVLASLTNKGKQFSAESIAVNKIMGEGSYGQVFEGALSRDSGTERVVLKRVKKRVQGAEQMGHMEHLLNVYANKAAKGSIADFVGYIEVAEEQATTKLTQGVWLMWRYEGHRTLSYYLKRRDCIAALSEDMGVDKSAVVATIVKQVLESIAALHAAGLVHRDVKPMNIIFAEDEKRFKLIDLGACADLRSGTNYIPDESILDPTYCPPEQYCMPTDAPHLSKHGALAMAMSPLLWQRFKPDRFDSYSAGLVLMQLSIAKLRTGNGLKAFNTALKASGFDLMSWRRKANLPARDTAILDADDGSGWELAEALLRPREIEVDEESGSVKFVNSNHEAIRLGVGLALTHNFLKQAQQPSGDVHATRALSKMPSFGKSLSRSLSRGSGSSSSGSTMERAASAAAATGDRPSSSGQGGMLGMAVGVWRKATSKLFDLEAKIANQTAAVQTQTARVQQLQSQAATGKVSVKRVEKEQNVLFKMTGRLAGLTTEFNATAQSANRILGSLMNRGKGPTTPESPDAVALNAAETIAAPRKSARRSDLPPSLQKQSSLSASLQKAREQQQELTAAAAQAAASVQEPVQASRARQEQPQQGRTASERPKPVRQKLSKKSIGKPEAAPAAASGGGAGGGGGAGVNMLYAGLKFTGLALNVAGGLAKAVRQDAERMMKELEADAAAKKLSKESAAAFVDLLRQADPPITSHTSFAAIEAQCQADDRWQALSDDKRQQVFDTYSAAVTKMEAAAHQRAVADFKVMLSESDIRPETDWSSLQGQLSSLAAFTAVKSDEDRHQLFQEYTADLQAAADRAAAVALCEEEFWGLLEGQDPPLTPRSSWPALRRQVAQDPRYTALQERCCRQLFNQFHSTLKDQQPLADPTPVTSSAGAPSSSLPTLHSSSPPMPVTSWSSSSPAESERMSASRLAQTSTSAQEESQQQHWEDVGPGQGLAELTQQAGAQMPTAGDMTNGKSTGGWQSAGQLDALEALRLEQARLKAEYDRMEAKLLEMEARLRIKEAGQKAPDASPGPADAHPHRLRSTPVSGNGAVKTSSK